MSQDIVMRQLNEFGILTHSKEKFTGEEPEHGGGNGHEQRDDDASLERDARAIGVAGSMGLANERIDTENHTHADNSRTADPDISERCGGLRQNGVKPAG